MNPLFDLWRQLDRYLIRNHAGLRLLQLHRLHVGGLAGIAMLALVVFLLPWNSLLEFGQLLRFLTALFGGLFLLVLPVILSLEGPFVRRSRWPHVLSVWYCIMIASTPIFVLPWMIQARVRQHVLHSRDAERWSSTLRSSSDVTTWDQHCERAMAQPGMPQAEQLDSICSLLSPGWLDPLGLGHALPDWLGVLLLLLLLAQRSLFIFSSEGDSFLEGIAALFGLFVTPLLGFIFVAAPFLASTVLLTGGIIAVLVLYSLARVARARRITPTFILNWSMVLTGVPLLTILGHSLLKPMEVHYQALYLGLALLLTAWLQRIYDRMRALPS